MPSRARSNEPSRFPYEGYMEANETDWSGNRNSSPDATWARGMGMRDMLVRRIPVKCAGLRAFGRSGWRIRAKQRCRFAGPKIALLRNAISSLCPSGVFQKPA